MNSDILRYIITEMLPDQESSQLSLRGLPREPKKRLRRARRAHKGLTHAERSQVLENIWAGGLEPALRRLAQDWKRTNHSFGFRVIDSNRGMSASSPEVADSTFDSQDLFKAQVEKAKRSKLPALTLVRRIVRTRPQLAQDLNDDFGWTREVIGQAIDITGAVYRLQPSTIADYKRQANIRVRRLEARLR